jgi:glucose dehydrogenase
MKRFISEQPWKRMMLVGLIYLALGIVSAVVSNPLQSGFLQTAIRVSIFLVVLAVYYYTLHLELSRSVGNIKQSALLTSGAVVVGTFLLAVYAIGMEWWDTSAVRNSLLIALILWPAATSIPAYLMALLLGYLTVRRRKQLSRLN